jgi:predicted GNAT family acetyltransferase
MPEAAAAALARHLEGRSYRFVGVNGEAAAATAFAEAWERQSGRRLPVAVATRFYRLGELRPPTGVPGWSRTATRDDRALMRRWAHAFHDEAMPEEPADDLDAGADRRVDLGQFTLWVDGDTVVSMAGHTDPAQGVARIGPVYTPPRFRGRGYGAAVTARASQVALDAGADEVVLYTDQSNPVSNAVYQRIGYVADHDAHERKVRD